MCKLNIYRFFLNFVKRLSLKNVFQLARREEREEKRKEKETLAKLQKANEKLQAAGHAPLQITGRKRTQNKGFAIGHVDPMEMGPDAADDWKSRR